MVFFLSNRILIFSDCGTNIYNSCSTSKPPTSINNKLPSPSTCALHQPYGTTKVYCASSTFPSAQLHSKWKFKLVLKYGKLSLLKYTHFLNAFKTFQSRPKRKRAMEEVNRRHTLDGRRGSKTKKPPRPLTDEDVAKTYTGMDRNLAEEFIQIAMEPGLAKERESRSNSDNNSNHLQ